MRFRTAKDSKYSFPSFESFAVTNLLALYLGGKILDF